MDLEGNNEAAKYIYSST